MKRVMRSRRAFITERDVEGAPELVSGFVLLTHRGKKVKGYLTEPLVEQSRTTLGHRPPDGMQQASRKEAIPYSLLNLQRPHTVFVDSHDLHVVMAYGWLKLHAQALKSVSDIVKQNISCLDFIVCESDHCFCWYFRIEHRCPVFQGLDILALW